MKDKPLITIATVTYNASDTLERTLRSVEEQNYPAVEHLIVDGCSTDNTLSLVQRYVERNTMVNTPRQIRLLCERDEGLYDAMNKAILQAQGNYIVFLNAGDKLHAKDTLSLLVSKVSWVDGDYSNPAILYGETDLVDDNGHFLRHRRLQAPKELGWRSFLNGMLVCHQSFYVRTDIAREEMYDLRYRFSADYDWCIRLLQKVEKRHIQILNSKLILTDYLSEGLTTHNHWRSLWERYRIMSQHYGCLAALGAHLWFVLRAVLRK